MRRKTKDLPAELKTPIRFDRVVEEAAKRRRAGLDRDNFIEADFRRKLTALMQYLGMQWPTNEEEWIKLVITICSHFAVVPGFTLVETGRSRRKEWPSWKYWELSVDVELLKKKNKKRTDYGACKFIAEHPQHYDNRYPTNLDTVHRQLMRAKEQEADPSREIDLATLYTEAQQGDFYATARRILKKLSELRDLEKQGAQKLIQGNLHKKMQD
jgi:hypothetical protein